MHYFHIWVRSDRYRSQEPLTYSHGGELDTGTIVEVPLRSEVVLGFVAKTVPKPSFMVKPIHRVLDLPPLAEITLALGEWLMHFYAAPLGVVTGQLLPPNIRTSNLANTRLDVPNPSLSSLTAEQQQALERITGSDTYVLHGRTGSGKTRIYIELTARALAAGCSALILSPEIGLTSQLASQFRAIFGNRVAVLHSQLTNKERLLVWLTILRSTEPLIVIGPRSALFSPIRKLGLIVVDEAHDQAYKQEQPPYYHSVRVAAQLRQLHCAVLVLGSATPSIADYYLAVERQKPIIRLQSLAISHQPKSKLTIVDLKDRTQFIRSPHISLQLYQAIEQSLENSEQSLLYLNRRGTARVTLCSNCGWQSLCPNCDLPLTYHGDAFRLRCHTCGFQRPPILTCPECGSQSIALKSFGTKAIVEEAQSLFPNARIARLDADSSKTERLEHQYEAIARGDIDILVGTQMLAKGLDLPHLSTLGIILADTSLYLPDYTARERTYQLLTQVLGRIGRGHLSGHAVIQTYYPDSGLLKAALADDWQNFYETELAERKQFLFPPFCHLLKLSCRRKSATSAERAMNTFRIQLEKAGSPIRIEGPAPSFHEKVSGEFQWQMVIKSRSHQELLDVLVRAPKGWSYDIDPSDLL